VTKSRSDQPTYYHFHIHITTTFHEPSATQATLKAFSLPNLIAQLETLAPDCESLADTSITYTIGEASELWAEVFAPLKEGRVPEYSKERIE
jgi:m7GpppX diphosphatase